MLSQLEYKCLLGDQREGAPSAVNKKKLELRPPCTHGVRDVWVHRLLLEIATVSRARCGGGVGQVWNRYEETSPGAVVITIAIFKGKHRLSESSLGENQGRMVLFLHQHLWNIVEHCTCTVHLYCFGICHGWPLDNYPAQQNTRRNVSKSSGNTEHHVHRWIFHTFPVQTSTQTH